MCFFDSLNITFADVAGGLWLPYKVSHPRAAEWGQQTLEYLQSIIHQVEKTNKSASKMTPLPLTSPQPGNAFGVFEVEWFAIFRPSLILFLVANEWDLKPVVRAWSCRRRRKIILGTYRERFKTKDRS